MQQLVASLDFVSLTADQLKSQHDETETNYYKKADSELVADVTKDMLGLNV